MISDKVKAWLAAGPASGRRSAAPGAETAAVGLNARDAADVFHVVEGALRSIDESIAALDRLGTKSKPADVLAHAALQHAGSPIRKVLQEARLGIRAEVEALKGMKQMSGESRRRLIMSSAGSGFEPMAEAGMTPVASQKGDL